MGWVIVNERFLAAARTRTQGQVGVDALPSMAELSQPNLALSVADLRRRPAMLDAKASEVQAQLRAISLEQSGVHIAAYTADQAMVASVSCKPSYLTRT